MNKFDTLVRRTGKAAVVILLFELLLLFPIPQPIAYVAMLNALGPSTEYHHPDIGTDVQGPDGRNYVFIGDEFYVWISIVRHKVNGNCKFVIKRYAEATDGPDIGKPKMISTETLRFVGKDELRRTRWPQPPTKLLLRNEVDDNNAAIAPLLPEGLEEQTTEFYVIGRYYCNVLDYIFPRYIQGGSEGETTRVAAVVKRTKPSWAEPAR